MLKRIKDIAEVVWFLAGPKPEGYDAVWVK